jgi:hypothetical protein
MQDARISGQIEGFWKVNPNGNKRSVYGSIASKATYNLRSPLSDSVYVLLRRCTNHSSVKGVLY